MSAACLCPPQLLLSDVVKQASEATAILTLLHGPVRPDRRGSRSRTIVVSTRLAAVRTFAAMPELDVQLLQRWLALAALIAGAAPYAGLLRRRQEARRWIAWKAEADRTGLQGLVRLFAADG